MLDRSVFVVLPNNNSPSCVKEEWTIRLLGSDYLEQFLYSPASGRMCTNASWAVTVHAHVITRDNPRSNTNGLDHKP